MFSSPPGAVSCRVRRPCGDVPGGAVPEHHSGHQLPGISAQEELAECQGSVHQDNHGTF